MQQKLWWDDRIIVLSMACNLLAVGLIFAMYSQGLGLPSSTVAPAQIVNMTKVSLAAKILFAWNICLTKLSILLMYYRIFDLSRLGKAYLVGIGAFVVLWSVVSTCLFVLTCGPIQKLWYPNLPGHCIDLIGRWIANAVSNVLTDLMMLFLPMAQVLRMTLSRTEKMAVALVFAQGFLCVHNLTSCFFFLASPLMQSTQRRLRLRLPLYPPRFLLQRHQYSVHPHLPNRLGRDRDRSRHYRGLSPCSPSAAAKAQG